MATAAKTTDQEPWLTDDLWNQPDGYHEEYPGGRHRFRWDAITWEFREVKGDPDGWIARGNGGEYRVDAAAGACSCKGNTFHGHCRHVDTLTVFFLKTGVRHSEANEEMSEEKLRAVFA